MEATAFLGGHQFLGGHLWPWGRGVAPVASDEKDIHIYIYIYKYIYIYVYRYLYI